MKQFLLAASAVFLFLLFSLCLCLVFFPPPVLAETMYAAVEPDSVLNVRFSPSGDIEGYYERGDAVEVLSVQGGWAAVDFGGNTFYCSADYLSSRPVDEPAACTVSASGRVRLRDSPGGSLVRWLEPGDSVAVLSWRTENGVEWARTDAGYVMAAYLEPQ